MHKIVTTIICAIAILLFSFSVHAEDHMIEKSYTHTNFIPKIGLSWGENLFIDIGVYRANTSILTRTSKSKENGVSHRTPFFNRSNFTAIGMHGVYVSTEVIKNNSNYLFGPKIGYELTNIAPTFASALGIELKYYTGAEDISDFAIAPKIGIPLGFFNIFYSYNVADSKIQAIAGKHIFSISFNLDYKAMKARSKMAEEMKQHMSRVE